MKIQNGLILLVFLYLIPYAGAAQVYKYHSSIGGTVSAFTNLALIDVDADGNIYALDKKDAGEAYDLVRIFNSANQLIDTVELKTEDGNSGLYYVSNFKIGPNGYFYGLDMESGIIVFDMTGQEISRINYAYDLPDNLYLSTINDFFINSDNSLYILDYNRVFIIGSDGEFLDVLDFSSDYYLVSFTSDHIGNIYFICEEYSGEYTLLKYDINKESRRLFSLPSPAYKLAVDTANHIWIPYNVSGNLFSVGYFSVYNDSGELLRELRGYDAGYSSFTYLNQVVFKNDRIYVVDKGSDDFWIPVSQPPYDRIIVYDYVDDEAGIIGPNRIPVNTPTSYRLLPDVDGFSYSCEYTGENLSQVVPVLVDDMMFNSSTRTFIASEETTPGDLVCEIYSYDYNYYEVVSISLSPYVPKSRDGGSNLPELHCGEDYYSQCLDATISAFSFNNLAKEGMRCEGFGYKDFTLDTTKALVNIGQLYTATMRLVSHNPRTSLYAGIWIDFNNDGDFEDEGEFIGTTIAFDGIIKISNIQIPSYSNYTGDARMRVRSRPLKAFSQEESCLRANEPGETQDYAVNISYAVSLAASEAITPNNDGKNDFFVIKGIDYEHDNELIITDSYGRVVQRETNYMNNWPRQNNRDLLPIGTYYYFFKNGPGEINGFFVVNY